MTPPESVLGAEIERLEATIQRLKSGAAKDRQTIADLREEVARLRLNRAILDDLVDRLGSQNLKRVIDRVRKEGPA